MFQVKDDHIRLLDNRKVFYNIPSVENKIAASQILFIGKVVQDPLSDRPENDVDRKL